jgi:ATP-dependent Clp protease ATP-binding subunit ClpA
MFERFTDQARTVLVEAQAEAVETRVGFMGTEHLLIGMLREDTGLAAVILAQHGIGLPAVKEKVDAFLSEQGYVRGVDQAAALATLGIDIDAVRAAVEAAFGEGSLPDPATNPPVTPRVVRCLELALAASFRWRQRYIDTEHLLVGVLEEAGGLAASVLRDLGADLASLTDAVKQAAAPQAWAADHAWEEFLVRVRPEWDLPDGSLKEQLRARQRDGFDAAAIEQLAISQALERFATRMEEINTSLRHA